MANTIHRYPRSFECLITFAEIKKALEDGYAVYAIHTSLDSVGVRICDVKDRDDNPVKLYTGQWIDPDCIFMDSNNPPQPQQQTLF